LSKNFKATDFLSSCKLLVAELQLKSDNYRVGLTKLFMRQDTVQMYKTYLTRLVFVSRKTTAWGADAECCNDSEALAWLVCSQSIQVTVQVCFVLPER
jgi:hypothetical protein